MLKRIALMSSALCLAGFVFGAAPAIAQSSTCQQLGPMMQERERLMGRVNSLGRRNVNPQQACNLFGQLAANGTKTLAFVRENKDWCQIPDDFVNNLTSAQAQITRVRGQACNAARQQTQMQARARNQQQQARENLGPFGGSDTVTGGAWRVPQGAL